MYDGKCKKFPKNTRHIFPYNVKYKMQKEVAIKI